MCAGGLQTSSETFFRTSKFYKAGDEAPPVFIVDGVSYLSIKVLAAGAAILHNSLLVPFVRRRGNCSEVWERSAEVPSCVRRAGWGCCLVVVALQDGGVQLVATTRDNVSPSFVLEFLKRISIIIKVRQLLGLHAGLLRGAESSRRSGCQSETPCIRQPNSTACSGCSSVSASCQACLRPAPTHCSDRCTL